MTNQQRWLVRSVSLLGGTVNDGNGFVQLTKEPVAIGTTSIEYTRLLRSGKFKLV